RRRSSAVTRGCRSNRKRYGPSYGGAAGIGCFRRSRRAERGEVRPRRFGWKRHQDRLDITAGLQPECRPTVIKQIELDVAAAADQLVAPLLRCPGEPHPGPHDFWVDREKGFADRAKKGEIALPVAAVEIVEKDPAGTARLSPVL